ncbi:hypothetical protein [Bradyrhizobium sp. CCBAU 53380]|uniref:hypothetical protein n=1 Tax=Bradyrhizobium sp. CCBAU 53380 TaxID=1325117 RepID=UPI002303B9CA|nr:hypothetical protein [Bradyrhizobium sp. CCBAU 53380]MDA9424031.1 hypothetical protein [Bradyrhizobium sp. CCBAU 53380]
MMKSGDGTINFEEELISRQEQKDAEQLRLDEERDDRIAAAIAELLAIHVRNYEEAVEKENAEDVKEVLEAESRFKHFSRDLSPLGWSTLNDVVLAMFDERLDQAWVGGAEESYARFFKHNVAREHGHYVPKKSPAEKSNRDDDE